MPRRKQPGIPDDWVAISGYRMMWVFALFDLPMTTKAERKEYTHFRNFLLKDGFMRMQFSVYMRHCPSWEHAQVHVRRVEQNVPPGGEVRVLWITDKQFERMSVFFGKRRKKAENVPKQLEFF